MTMLGLLGGQILKGVQGHGKKLAWLLGAGAGCLILGYVWSLDFPIIKHLFTSSMVLWAAGWCYFLLALFYLLTDVLKLNWLTFFFSVIGSNAIFVYMWAELCPPRAISPGCCLPGSASVSGMRTGLSFICAITP